jgi:hypothetical protein
MPRHSPLKVNPLPVSAFTPEAADDPWEGSRDSAFGMPLYSMGEETGDNGDGSTEYYIDQSPGSPLESSQRGRGFVIWGSCLPCSRHSRKCSKPCLLPWHCSAQTLTE